MFWLIKYDFDKNIRKQALLCNYPRANIQRTVFYPYIQPTQQRPELICCPKELDFPRPEREHTHYIESIDMQRQEEQFPWERVASDRPLLYCSLGSRGHAYTHGRKFYQTVIDALASRQNWQAIIAIGHQLHPEDFHSVPANVLLVNWAPQMEVLQRASLMITHAGLGTIKECLYRAVPMIVFPVTGDHPGNAARVVYHGLGVMGDFRKVSVGQVLFLLNTIERDPAFKRRVEVLADKIRAIEASQPGLQIINAYLAAT